MRDLPSAVKLLGRLSIGVVLAVSAPAFTQSGPAGGDFTLPNFNTPPPPPPPLDPGATLTAPPPPPSVPAQSNSWNNSRPAPSQLPPPPPVRQQPLRWSTFAANVTALASFGRDIHLGGEIFLGAMFGATPEVLPDAPEEAGGRLWMAGLVGDYDSFAGYACGGQVFCGSRLAAGGGLRYGYGSGTFGKDGITGAERYYFGEADVLGAWLNVPIQPLTPGGVWGELILRAKFGINFALMQGNRVSLINKVSAAVYFEGVVVSLQGPSGAGGVMLGFAF